MSSKRHRFLQSFAYKQKQEKLPPTFADSTSPVISRGVKGELPEEDSTTRVTENKENATNPVQNISELPITDSESNAIESSPILKRKKSLSKRLPESQGSDDTVVLSLEENSDYEFCHYNSQSSIGMDERDQIAAINSLRQMFPVTDEKWIRKVLSEVQDIDLAINRLMNCDSRALGFPTPRSPRGKKGGSSSPSKPPPRKRVRIASESDDEEKPKIVSKSVSIEFLSNAFPDLSENLIDGVLTKYDFDQESAITELTSLSKEDIVELEEKYRPASMTTNLGSMKFYGNNRAKLKLSRRSRNDESDDEDRAKEGKLTTFRNKNKPKIKQEIKPEQEVTEKVKHEVKQEFKPEIKFEKFAASDEEEGLDEDEDGNDNDSDVSNSDEELAVFQQNVPLQDQVIKFFNYSDALELQTLEGCSKKKVDIILKLRPFESYDELLAGLQGNRSLGAQLLVSCRQLLKLRKKVAALLSHCAKISSDMQSLVTMLRDGKNSDGLTAQPEILTKDLKLKPYQMVGLNWLSLMYKQSLNGILADEMGLGKTIQTIAFLAHLLEQGNKGPHVIVAPSSTIDNWLRELQLWCPEMKVLLYYGSQDERRTMRNDIFDDVMDEFHVILTTYNMAAGSSLDRSLFRKLRYVYAIFDEGHMLKNMSSNRYQYLMKIRARHRLLLTGTPLQNNLIELLSLLCFIMPQLFDDNNISHLKVMFASMSNRSDNPSSYEKSCIEQAQGIMRPFLLRRLKKDVLSQLPSKIELVENPIMVPAQQKLYTELRDKFSRDFIRGEDSRRSGSMLMDLRKAANHPLLLRQVYTDTKLRKMAKLMLKEPTHCDAVEQLIFEDMQVMHDFELHLLCKQYKSVRPFSLDDEMIVCTGKFKFIEDLLEAGDVEKILIFSQFTMMLDIIQEFLQIRGVKYLRMDGQTAVIERQDLIDDFSKDETVRIFLLSTRAGGLGINLTCANTVVIHDIDFNPYNDKQAEDRCHRLGQEKVVTVYRLLSRGSVEETIFRCGTKKLELEQDVTGGTRKKDEENYEDVASILREVLN